MLNCLYCPYWRIVSRGNGAVEMLKLHSRYERMLVITQYAEIEAQKLSMDLLTKDSQQRCCLRRGSIRKE